MSLPHKIDVFKTEDFEFDFEIRCIRFFRDRFPYSSLHFEEVNRIEISYGRSVKNAGLLFLIATILASTSILLIVRLWVNFDDLLPIETLKHSDIRRIGTYLIISLSLLFFSTFIFYSLRKQLILKINKGKQLFPLKEIISKGELDQFKNKLKNSFPAAWVEN